MGPIIDGLIGAGSVVLTGLVTAVAALMIRLWRTPKRVERLEVAIPVLIRATLVQLRCLKAGKCNGEADETISEVEAFLSNNVISVKEKK
jgi:hypothetical protein